MERSISLPVLVMWSIVSHWRTDRNSKAHSILTKPFKHLNLFLVKLAQRPPGQNHPLPASENRLQNILQAVLLIPIRFPFYGTVQSIKRRRSRFHGDLPKHSPLAKPYEAI